MFLPSRCESAREEAVSKIDDCAVYIFGPATYRSTIRFGLHLHQYDGHRLRPDSHSGLSLPDITPSVLVSLLALNHRLNYMDMDMDMVASYKLIQLSM